MSIHSEYNTMTKVGLKSAKASFVSQDQISQQWKELNYLHAPEFNQAVNEYSEFERILSEFGTKIEYFPHDAKTKMDCIYCRDASIATDFGMIICNMGKKGRKNEPNSHLEFYKSSSIHILGKIETSGTLEGGDVCWIDENTLAVGHSYRTNENGINQLKDLLEPKGVEVIVADLPHYRGASDVFHLMSILSPVDKNLAVVYSPLMPISFRNYLKERGFQFIEVPDNEFESMGCNVLAIASRVCLMVKGNPVTQEALESAGCKVYTYDGRQISIPGGGGPTCLTRPLERKALHP